jgi:NAD(P)H-hydrate repair Nnr-like enzyme with NAD(P)H-hydrate dehydratase domain
MEDVVRVSARDFAGVYPKRKANSNKYDYGRLLMICGAEGYSGAACLSARAASRAGAGLVTLCVPERIYNIVASKLDEVIVRPLPCGKDGMVSKKAVPKILSLLSKADVCLAGCGLGRGKGPSAVIAALIKNCRVPLILDADGINALSGNINLLSRSNCEIILTPHDGELSRLVSSLPPDFFASTPADFADSVPKNPRLLPENPHLFPKKLQERIDYSRKISLSLGVTLVRKGPESLTISREGSVFVNSTGNPGLAKAGSGDVLSGIIAALSARKNPLEKAVAAGVFLHGLAGDICAAKLGEDFMTPSDVLDALSEAIKTIKE